MVHDFLTDWTLAATLYTLVVIPVACLVADYFIAIDMELNFQPVPAAAGYFAETERMTPIPEREVDRIAEANRKLNEWRQRYARQTTGHLQHVKPGPKAEPKPKTLYDLGVRELRPVCTALGIKGASRFDKARCIAELTQRGVDYGKAIALI